MTIDNLPTKAQKLGGAVVTVLQWEQHQSLSAVTQYHLGEMIVENPRLNTESRVDMLADMAAFYGERFDIMLIGFIETHSPERVYLALDTLHETGNRDRSGKDRDQLESLLTVLEALAYYGSEPTTVSMVVAEVDKLGGFELTLGMSFNDIQARLERPEDYANEERL